jgi:hypothetical protein
MYDGIEVFREWIVQSTASVADILVGSSQTERVYVTSDR